MSMRELAAKTFVSHSKVQRWENGERPPKDRAEAELIDKQLNAGGLTGPALVDIGQAVSAPGHVSVSAPDVSDTSLVLATSVSQTAASDGEGIFIPPV